MTPEIGGVSEDGGIRWEESGSQPVSRVLSRTVIHLGPVSPLASRDLPGPDAGSAKWSLFGLAPSGVCRTVDVATNVVRSYRTVSPLPVPLGGHRRSTLCCTFRRLTSPRHYLAPCPMEPGLSSTLESKAATVRLTPTATLVKHQMKEQH